MSKLSARAIFISIFIVFSSCRVEIPTQFNDISLKAGMINSDGKEFELKQVLKDHSGNKVLIDVWASWCGDCLEAVDDLKAFRKANPEVHLVMFSVDKGIKNWKWTVEKMKIPGDHYYLNNGWENDFNDFISLREIPRYILVGENGEILLFDFDDLNDSRLIKKIKNLT